MAMPSIAITAASAPSTAISMIRVGSALITRSRQSPPRGQPQLRLRRAVGAPDIAEGAGAARAALGGEAREGAGLEVDPPVAEHHHLVGVVGLGRVAFDDQDAHQAAAELLGRVAVGVEEEGAGVGRGEAVAEAPAGLDRRLRQIGHAVLVVRQADAVPVDRAVLALARQAVLEDRLEPVAELHAARSAATSYRTASTSAGHGRRSTAALPAARRRPGGAARCGRLPAPPAAGSGTAAAPRPEPARPAPRTTHPAPAMNRRRVTVRIGVWRSPLVAAGRTLEPQTRPWQEPDGCRGWLNPACAGSAGARSSRAPPRSRRAARRWARSRRSPRPSA